LWAAAPLGISHPTVYSVGVAGTTVLAGTYEDGVYRSTDGGATWAPSSTGITVLTIRHIAANGSDVYASTFSGRIYLSTNSGQNWSETAAPTASGTIQGFAFAGSAIFAASDYGGVWRSTNRGAAWEKVNEGLLNLRTWPIVVSGDKLFVGTHGAGVWRRPLAEIATAVADEGASPVAVSLLQNYPNPFNPSTTIRYGLPDRSQVTLAVFNTLGQQVAVLQSGEQEAGYHEVKFDGSGLSSGVYFYRLRAGEFVESKQFLLLR